MYFCSKLSNSCVIFGIYITIVSCLENIYDQGKYIQKFSLHGDERCEDGGEIYTGNERNLLHTSKLVAKQQLRCACVDFGVWSYSSKINYYGGEFGGSHLAITRIEGEKSCIAVKRNSTILSLRKVGNSDVTKPAISLYIDFSLRGRELYFDGRHLELPWPLFFRSVGFTGLNVSWSFFPKTDLTGVSTSLKQKDNTLITYSSGSKSILIGSIQQHQTLLPVSDNHSSSPSIKLNLRDRSKSLKLDGNELRLPYPITAYSYTLIGQSNWTLFRGILFNGRSKCIKFLDEDKNLEEAGPQNFEDDNGEYPIASVVVGSIRKGCGSDIWYENEDYENEKDDDIYDYEDGYGGINSSSSLLFISCDLIVVLILLFLQFW